MRLSALATLALALTCLLALVAGPAMAQDGTVTIPWGNWLSEIIGLLGSLLIAVLLPLALLWLIAHLPAPVKAWLDKERIARVEQLLARAVGYGLNAVAGAARGKVLTVHVGSKVVAEAAQYAVDNAPDKLIDWMGGPEEIKKKIVARLDLDENATADAVLANTPRVKPGT